VTLISILTNVLIEAITLMSLSKLFVGGYQSFSYNAEAMTTLYYQRLD